MDVVRNIVLKALKAYGQNNSGLNNVGSQGRIQDFHWGGGGGKRLCARITSATPEVPYTAGVQALEALVFFCGAFSCYLSLIF